jgi:hypothetical protein
MIIQMSQEDQTFRARLQKAYFKLRKSRLCVHKDISEGSLKFFEECLNEAMPRNSFEHEQMRIIKDLYYNSPRLTYQVITAERDGTKKQSIYILWTNAWCITRHFDIESLVYLDWDTTKNSYNVRLPQPNLDQQEQKHYVKSTDTSDTWLTVDKKKYRPYKGKKNNRLVQKKSDSNQESSLETAVIDQFTKKDDAWD